MFILNRHINYAAKFTTFRFPLSVFFQGMIFSVKIQDIYIDDIFPFVSHGSDTLSGLRGFVASFGLLVAHGGLVTSPSASSVTSVFIH